ncbi:hypothetical protein N7522_012706 [Penicillium canescens]|nr:hypothetical protein N7522_012706 [Penicillium canescens]
MERKTHQANRLYRSYTPQSEPVLINRIPMQICTLTLAPAFWPAVIYLTLKHKHYSLIRAKWYPYIFATCDIISLVFQGAGGGISATAKTASNIDIGSDIMIAGIVWQVITLTVFGLTSAHFLLRIKGAPKEELTFEAQRVWKSQKYWSFFWGTTIAFATTYIRCVYRVVEMAGAWKNDIMQDEFSFPLFESA